MASEWAMKRAIGLASLDPESIAAALDEARAEEKAISESLLALLRSIESESEKRGAELERWACFVAEAIRRRGPMRGPEEGSPDRTWAGEHCQLCGRSYAIWWAASNDLWNRVTGLGEVGLRCPDCFHAEAMAKGILLRFDAVVDSERFCHYGCAVKHVAGCPMRGSGAAEQGRL